LLLLFLPSFGEDRPEVRSPNSSNCANLLDSGDRCYASFDNFRALSFYRGARERCPALYESIMKTTRALIDCGEDRNSGESDTFYAQGLRCADTLLHYYPDSGQSYFLKALAAANFVRRKGRKQQLAYAEIIYKYVNKSIELTPSFSPAYILLGAFYRKVASATALDRLLARMFVGGVPKGTLKDSRIALEKALELSPRNVEAHLELAKTEIALRNDKKAAILLKEMNTLPLQWHLDKKVKEEGRQLLEKLNAPGISNR
jgi:hypothetical protein